MTEHIAEIHPPSSVGTKGLFCCIWEEDEDGNWDSECGDSFVFVAGGPEENNFTFCPYCGRCITSLPYAADEEDD